MQRLPSDQTYHSPNPTFKIIVFASNHEFHAQLLGKVLLSCKLQGTLNRCKTTTNSLGLILIPVSCQRLALCTLNPSHMPQSSLESCCCKCRRRSSKHKVSLVLGSRLLGTGPEFLDLPLNRYDKEEVPSWPQ